MGAKLSVPVPCTASACAREFAEDEEDEEEEEEDEGEE